MPRLLRNPRNGGGPARQKGALGYVLASLMSTALGSAVVSLATSALGGWMGANHVQRVYHLRPYAAHHGGSR